MLEHAVCSVSYPEVGRREAACVQKVDRDEELRVELRDEVASGHRVRLHIEDRRSSRRTRSAAGHHSHPHHTPPGHASNMRATTSSVSTR